jgi:hypothetical protein
MSNNGEDEVIVSFRQEVVFNKRALTETVPGCSAGCNRIFRTNQMVTPVVFPSFLAEFAADEDASQRWVLFGFPADQAVLQRFFDKVSSCAT